MKVDSVIRPALQEALEGSYSDRHMKILMEYFADVVDNRIQASLMTDLITRYVEVSRQLEAKNAELSRSDARRREAQKIALLGDWELDLQTQELHWSKNVYNILEYTPGETPTLAKSHNRLHPDDITMVMRVTEQVLEGKRVRDQRYRLLMPDNRIKWIHVRHKQIMDEDGRVVAMRGTLQDITESKLIEEQLQQYNTHLEDLVQEKVQEIVSSRTATIYALVKLAESRDDETGTHIERTAVYCRLMAEKLRKHGYYTGIITDDFIENISLASPLHDIGKVGIPDAILLKPGKLTMQEYEVMKTHVSIGYDTLARLEEFHPANNFLRFGMSIARYHHERWDGTGYMEGLAGEDIPLSARIMALADVYDALRSRRVYKRAYTHRETADIIEAENGSYFDPAIVEMFLLYHHEFEAIFDQSETTGI